MSERASSLWFRRDCDDNKSNDTMRQEEDDMMNDVPYSLPYSHLGFLFLVDLHRKPERRDWWVLSLETQCKECLRKIAGVASSYLHYIITANLFLFMFVEGGQETRAGFEVVSTCPISDFPLGPPPQEFLCGHFYLTWQLQLLRRRRLRMPAPLLVALCNVHICIFYLLHSFCRPPHPKNTSPFPNYSF